MHKQVEDVTCGNTRLGKALAVVDWDTDRLWIAQSLITLVMNSTREVTQARKTHCSSLFHAGRTSQQQPVPERGMQHVLSGIYVSVLGYAQHHLPAVAQQHSARCSWIQCCTIALLWVCFWCCFVRAIAECSGAAEVFHTLFSCPRFCSGREQLVALKPACIVQ